MAIYVRYIGLHSYILRAMYIEQCTIFYTVHIVCLNAKAMKCFVKNAPLVNINNGAKQWRQLCHT